jgi:hypothetical protein
MISPPPFSLPYLMKDKKVFVFGYVYIIIIAQVFKCSSASAVALKGVEPRATSHWRMSPSKQ